MLWIIILVVVFGLFWLFRCDNEWFGDAIASTLLAYLITFIFGIAWFMSFGDDYTRPEIVEERTKVIPTKTLVDGDQFIMGRSEDHHEVWYRDTCGEYGSVMVDHKITFVHTDTVAPNVTIKQTDFKKIPNGTVDKTLFFFSLYSPDKIHTYTDVTVTLPVKTYWSNTSTKQNLRF